MCNLTTSFYPFLQAAINAVHPLLSLVLKSTMYNGKSVARFARNVVKRDYFEWFLNTVVQEAKKYLE